MQNSPDAEHDVFVTDGAIKAFGDLDVLAKFAREAAVGLTPGHKRTGVVTQVERGIQTTVNAERLPDAVIIAVSGDPDRYCYCLECLREGHTETVH
jgi:hypothetical protein